MFKRTRSTKDFAEEIEAHLELEADELRREGLSEDESHRKARVEFGNVSATQELFYLKSRIVWLDNLLRDVRFAIRQLVKHPGFAATAILVLALGIGASVAIFAFVDAALIEPLPYPQPGQLVSVFEAASMCPRCNVSYLNFRDWKKSSLPFTSLEAWGFKTYLLPAATGAQSVPGARVTDGFFRTLGVTPVLGRDFYAGEDAPGKPSTVLISYSAWKSRFGGRLDVVGQTIKLSDDTYTVIGVLPPQFHFAPRDAEFWATLNDPTSCEKRRSCHSLFALARLSDGVPVQGALAAMKSIAQQMEKQYPDNRGYSADVVPLSEWIVGDIRPILLLLLGGAALLLLIACVNVSSLLLVRSESRGREIAIRGALGASRGRLLWQFVTEGLVLVATGSVLGLASALIAMRLLIRLVPADMLGQMPYLQGLGFNLHVLAFSASVSLFAVLLFSIAPILRLSRNEVQVGLSDGGRTSAGTVWRRLGSRLVVVELAIAMVLLVGAGLLGKSLYRLLHVDIGMQPDHLATLGITLPASYAEDKQIMQVERELEGRIGALPGVKSVGITTSLPSRSWGMATNILVAGRPWNGVHNTVPERDVSPDYLKAIGAKLLRGRYFSTTEDDPSKAHVAVINQAFARQYFPGEDAIGKHLLYEGSHDSTEIVGVVEDVKEGPLDSANQPALYDTFSSFWFRSFYIVVRTSQAEETILPTLTDTIHKIDPGIATSEPSTMNELINSSESAYLHRSSASLIAGFATLALLLGTVGLYGVVAYSASQRTREIGIRIALGAQRSSVYGIVMRQAGWLTLAGLAIGLVCSVCASVFMHKLLFGVRAWDPMTLAGVVLLLGLASMAASFLPARRAASVNPTDALRAE
jgi:macrolide transport system ATP-binding/permease protein